MYTLDDEDSAAVKEIFDRLPADTVVKRLRTAMDAVADAVCDSLLDHVKGEYQLRFEEIALQHSRKSIEALLRGENLQTFGLQLQEAWNRPGEFFAYDGNKVREALVRDFAAEIQTAEMHELKKENERLAKELEFYKRRDAH